MSLHAQQKVIGGSAVDISQRPYQAAIFINGQFTAGGVIINNQWILTAAHVLYGKSGSTITVSTGYTNLNNDPSRSAVSNWYIHPSYVYSNDPAPYDIALIKLASPLTFGTTRRPINLSKSTSYSTGTTATVSGWGARSQSLPNIASTNQLYKTTGTISSCSNNYIELKKSTTSAYRGDSGGPLTISNTEDLLIGIVCGGKTSDPSAEPSIYTNVGTYHNWIASYADLYFISGPDLINNGATASFTISAPGGTLELSPNLSIVSQSGKNYTIKANSSGRAYINLKAGNSYVVRTPLWVGAPIISGITYNGSTLTVETFGGDAHINRTEWTIGGNVFTAYSNFISSPYSTGTYTVSVRATNGCGTGGYYTTQISFSDRGTFSLAVEPGSRIVTVTPILQEDDEAAVVLANRKSTANATMRYVLADLTSGSLKATGYLPESGGTLDFSNAPAGMYVFKLYTSAGAEETFKISLK
ncbi:serine protease [Parabacteroides sp.]